MMTNELAIKAMAAVVKRFPHITVSAEVCEENCSWRDNVWLVATLRSERWTQPRKQRAGVRVLLKGEWRGRHPAANDEQALTILLAEVAFLDETAHIPIDVAEEPYTTFEKEPTHADNHG